MGCSSSCKIAEQFSSAIKWIAQAKLAIPNTVHILDDFLLVDQSEKGCKKKQEILLSVCSDIGVPMSKEKDFFIRQKL